MATSRPPIAGPEIEANCHEDVTQPIALAKSSLGTTLTTNDDDAGVKNARATPNIVNIAKTRVGLNWLFKASIKIAMAHAISNKIDSPITSRRPNLSDASPVTKTNNTAGRNWTSPIQPNSNGFLV